MSTIFFFKITYISFFVTRHGQVDEDVALRAASGLLLCVVTPPSSGRTGEEPQRAGRCLALGRVPFRSVTDHRKSDKKRKAQSLMPCLTKCIFFLV